MHRLDVHAQPRIPAPMYTHGTPFLRGAMPGAYTADPNPQPCSGEDKTRESARGRPMRGERGEAKSKELRISRSASRGFNRLD